VAVAGQLADPQERGILDQLRGRTRLRVERLHAHEPAHAVARRHPPAPPVAIRIVVRRRVHVGGDLVHARRIEPAAQVQEAGFVQEVGHLRRIIVGRERAGEIERRSDAVAERDASRRMDRAAIERGAQHDPPVEQIAEPAVLHGELSRAIGVD
jgi:hypothetical protein